MGSLRNILILIVLSCFLVACGGKDYKYQDSNEDNPGPGLLSGTDGEFHLLEKHKAEEGGEQGEVETKDN